MTAGHLRGLVQTGKLQKSGSTQNALNHQAANRTGPATRSSLSLTKLWKGLAEDRIFTGVDSQTRIAMDFTASTNTFGTHRVQKEFACF